MKLYFIDGVIVNEYLAGEQAVLDTDCDMHFADSTDAIECWTVARSDSWCSGELLMDFIGYMGEVPYSPSDVVEGSVFVSQEQVDHLRCIEQLAHYAPSELDHLHFFKVHKIENNVTFDQMIKDL